MRTNPVTGKKRLHNGIDLGIPQGTPVFPTATGVVKSSDPTCRSAVNGGYVTIRHGDGSVSGYIHLSRVDVRKGQQVGWWTQLGLSGGRKGDRCSGRSTGPHLHFIIRPNGKTAADPIRLVNWWPFSLKYKGRNLPVVSRQWGGALVQLRQTPWWIFALGGAGLLVLVAAGVRARRRPRALLA
ncbi:hypothetical protein CMI37_07610 [Candidatus Pacearchaeota archaeon]|nr:hypothetical protein [Candidatus Pacearchaeota archaeon]